MISILRLGLVITSSISASTMVFANETKRPPVACTKHLTAAHGADVGRLFASGSVLDADVVGLVPLSRAEFGRLIADGELKSDVGFQVNPLLEHPEIKAVVENRPEFELNVFEGYDQRRATFMDSWLMTTTALIRDRITAAGGSIADDVLFEAFVDSLRPTDIRPGSFTVSVDRLAGVAEAIELPVEPVGHVDATINRGLARRLGVGPNLPDLRRWNLIRAVSVMLDLPWHDGPAKPTLDERLIREFLTDIPSAAGVTVAIRAGTLNRLVWSTLDAPRIKYLGLVDLAGIESLGDDELATLWNLIPSP